MTHGYVTIDFNEPDMIYCEDCKPESTEKTVWFPVDPVDGEVCFHCGAEFTE